MLALVAIQLENINSYFFKKKSRKKRRILHFPIAVFSNFEIPLLHKQVKAVTRSGGCKLGHVTLSICVWGSESKTEHNIPTRQWLAYRTEHTDF